MASKVVLNGFNLNIEEVLKISFCKSKLQIDENCWLQMSKAQKIIHDAKKANFPVYGLTRDVGQFKNEIVQADRDYDHEVLVMHSTILGDPEEPEFYPEPICRGAWTILVNGFVRGGSCATSDLVKAMIQWLNSNEKPPKIEYGTSIGMADAIPLMQMAIGILPVFYKVQSGEGLALLSSNALSMSETSHTLAKLVKVLKMADMGLALALLAEGGNMSIIGNPGKSAARHWKHKLKTIENIQHLLTDNPIMDRINPNNNNNNNELSTPHSHMTLRAACDILASAQEALEHATKATEEMMNSHQGNPYVDLESQEIGSVANFDSTRLFNILTYVQTSMGCLLTSIVRRGEYKVNMFGELLDRKSLIERYILWHLETCGRAAALKAQPVAFGLSRMAGAQEIEDWAAPLPEVCSRLTKLVIHAKRIVTLESLLSAIVIKAKEEPLNGAEELVEFHQLLVDHSPMGQKFDKQYSMEQLFEAINSKHYFL